MHLFDQGICCIDLHLQLQTNALKIGISPKSKTDSHFWQSGEHLAPRVEGRSKLTSVLTPDFYHRLILGLANPNPRFSCWLAQFNQKHQWHSAATLSELFVCSSQLSNVFTVLVKAYNLVLFLDFGLEICINSPIPEHAQPEIGLLLRDSWLLLANSLHIFVPRRVEAIYLLGSAHHVPFSFLPFHIQADTPWDEAPQVGESSIWERHETLK